MSDIIKTYYASRGAMTGTSGFTNFAGGSDVQVGLAKVWLEHPSAIVVNGSDNWYSKLEERPQGFVQSLGFKPIAWFHSGISGIVRSGAVLSPETFEALVEAYKAAYNRELGVMNTVYWPPTPKMTKKKSSARKTRSSS